MSFEQPILMLAALCALYSPLASVSSYFPIVSQVRPSELHRLAIGLFFYVLIFAQAALWVGEPLLELLGLTTAALTATGGIALMAAAVPLMMGRGLGDEKQDPNAKQERNAWRSLLLMPATFPLTVGGTTFAIIVSFRAGARNLLEVGLLAATLVVYALVTAVTVYISGFLERRLKERARQMLQRIAGILLTAIAITLLTKGIPQLVVDALAQIERSH